MGAGRWVGVRLAVVVVVAVVAFAPRPASALCICAEFEGCSSALSCDGSNPGDACSPPRSGTCKIVKGNGNGLSCCCGCTRGPGPISCVYDGVVEQLAALDVLVCESAAATVGAAEACTCVDRKLKKRTSRSVLQAGGKLRGAQAGCGKGKDPRRKVSAAKQKLTSLDGSVDRLVERQKVTPECGVALKDLITTLGVAIDTASEGGVVTTTTTPAGGTTTTTTTPGPVCTGSLDVPPGFPDERNFAFTCTGPGSPTFSGFTLHAPNGFQFVNQIDPSAFTCVIQQGTNPNDAFVCTGPFGLGDTITGGRVALLPTPTDPFALDLTVVNGTTLGPFPID